MSAKSPSVVGFAGYSGSGKTSLIKKIIPLLKAKGLRIAVLKHAHHQFDVDTPGKDSYEVRKAGADQVLVASQYRWALMVETPQRDSVPSLRELLKHIDSNQIDLILVEGFKTQDHPKIEVHRDSANNYLYPSDPQIIAIATDSRKDLNLGLPQLDINDPDAVCDFIMLQL